MKHYLQDVGSTFGMANNPHEWDMGWEYFYDQAPSRRRLLSFGFALSPWQTVPYTEYPSIGRFEGDRFDPADWKPQTPVAPFIEMRADDAFWAARRVMAFSDELIRAAVHTGHTPIRRRSVTSPTYSSNAATPLAGSILPPSIRSSIRSWTPAGVTFSNAAVDAGFAAATGGYHAAWSRFDNATGQASRIAETRSATTTMPAPDGLPAETGRFIEIDISAEAPIIRHGSSRSARISGARRTAGSSSAFSGCPTDWPRHAGSGIERRSDR